MKLTFRYEEAFDSRVERRPALYFRLARSLMVRHKQVPIPVLGDEPLRHGQKYTIEIPQTVWKAALQESRTHFLVGDLFCDTTSELDTVELECRREVARCIATFHDVKLGKTVRALDQVAQHCKFALVFDPHPHISVSDADSKETIQKAEEMAQEMFQLAHKSNKTFVAQRAREWIHRGAHAMNVSYVEMLTIPGSSSLRPVPGWVDLRHLALDVSQRLAPETYYASALRNAMRRCLNQPKKWHELTREEQCEILCDAAAWLARRSVYLPDTVDVTPFDADQDAKRPPRKKRVIKSVDYYNFPRVVDELHRVGDDCESLSKDTLLFIMELQALTNITDALVQAAQDLSRQFVWVQTTGGVSAMAQIPLPRRFPSSDNKLPTLAGRFMGSSKLAVRTVGSSKCLCSRSRLTTPKASAPDANLAKSAASAATSAAGGQSDAPPFWMNPTLQTFQEHNLICHSWILGIERDVFHSWVEQGSSVLTSSSLPRPGPAPTLPKKNPTLLNVESTECIAAVSYQDEEKDDEDLDTWHAFRACPSFAAFRIKLPFRAWRDSGRYVTVSTLTLWDTELVEQLGAAEFVLASIQPDGNVVKGVEFQRMLDHPESIVLLPTVLLTPRDFELAQMALDYFPPVPPMPFSPRTLVADSFFSTLLLEVDASKQQQQQQVFIREQDWATHQPILKEWCLQHGYDYFCRVQADFDQALTIVFVLFFLNGR